MSNSKILIVDDDKDFRASTRALLEANGYEVIEASSGKEGLDLVRSGRPDLIILDVVMESPVEGYLANYFLKFTEQNKEISKIPILMVSSIQDPPDSRFSRSGEAVMITPEGYMTKPIDIPTFLARVKQMIGR